MKRTNAVEIPKNALRLMYQVEKKSLNEIAKFFKCSETSVFRNMVKYKIKRRTVTEGMRLLHEQKSRNNN